MKRSARIALMCLFVSVPSAAHADDGGWLDWLYRMDAKFVGVSTEVHFWCGAKDGQRIPCEEWYGLNKLFGETAIKNKTASFSEIKHEVNLRFSYYRTYGDLYPASSTDKSLPGKTANAIKVMGFYSHAFSPHISAGAGAGVMPFYGGDMGSAQWSGIISGAVRWAPFAPSTSRGSSFFLHFEESYLSRAIVPGSFAPSASASSKGEWNGSLGIGFDFRRR